MKHIILSLDGGGVRGIISIDILAKILIEVPKLLDHVQLFAGTSIGGINALALASGIEVERIAKLYTQNADEIFRRNWRQRFRLPGNIVKAKYNGKALEKALVHFFQGKRLFDLEKHVLIPSVNIKAVDEESLTTIHTNYPNDGKRLNTCVEVSMRTAAAPTYFPVRNGHVDGGLSSNSPVMLAVTELVSRGVPLSDIFCLSIGAGSYDKAKAPKRKSSGILKWIRHLTPIQIACNVGVANYQAAHILPSGHFIRINMELPYEIALDDYKQIAFMRHLVKQFKVDTMIISTLKWWLTKCSSTSFASTPDTAEGTQEE